MLNPPQIAEKVGEPMSNVSVVMATYNGGRFLRAQLDSLFNQTVLPFELIVADDGSTDETLSLLEEAAGAAPMPMTIIRNARNLGFADNFLSASMQVRSELVAFCDQDDVWRADKIAKVQPVFDNPATMLCAHRGTLINDHGKDIGPFDQEITRNRRRGPLSLDPWAVYFGFSMTFRRSLLDVLPWTERATDYVDPRMKLSHDRWVTLLANMCGDTVELEERLVGYRQHSSNLFGANFQNPKSIFDRSVALASSELKSQCAENCYNLCQLALPAAADRFPSLNVEQASAFWRRARCQQDMRSALYRAPSGLPTIERFLRNLASGCYIAVNSPTLLLRWVAKDGLIALSR